MPYQILEIEEGVYEPYHDHLGLRLWSQIIFEDPCAYCGRHYRIDQMSIDHIVSRFRGGTNNFLNITIACKKCNNKKANKSLLGFLLGDKEYENEEKEIQKATNRMYKKTFGSRNKRNLTPEERERWRNILHSFKSQYR